MTSRYPVRIHPPLLVVCPCTPGPASEEPDGGRGAEGHAARRRAPERSGAIAPRGSPW